MCRCFCGVTVSAAVEAGITQSNIFDRQSVWSVSAMRCHVTSVDKLIIELCTTHVDDIEVQKSLVSQANSARSMVSVTSKRCR